MPSPTEETTQPVTPPVASDESVDGVVVRRPSLDDGAAMWRIARDSQVLDVNASYAYLLWCRDFAATSVVATVDGAPAGFVTGYLRPDRPDTLMVWQVAVDAGHRGKRIASRMLAGLVDQVATPVACLETTITADNEASISLFTAFARSRGAEIAQEPIFDSSHFPDGHDGELLFRIAPLS
jgi:diaminobutyrate acetyltransferase